MTPLTKKDALALLNKYDVDPRVMAHLLAVHDYAMEIAEKLVCDRDLVEVGSLIHDIGRTKSHGIDHALIGAEILRSEGVDERVIKIVERHIGAGLTPVEAGKLGLPPGNYVPESIEEKIVCHADNLIGDNERVSIQETIAMARKKWFPESVERLIRMHYEVFKPDVILLKENALKGIFGDFNMIEKFLDRELKNFDLLYKISIDDKPGVSLFGQDSRKAADHLVNKGFGERY